MKHFTFLKSLLLLCALVVGSSAWATDFVINTTNFTKPNSGSGYAAYDGTRSISGINIVSSNVMVQNSSLQFKKSVSASLYNSNAMPGNITKITLSTATNFTIYVGTSSNPNSTTVTSGSTISGSYKYFKIENATSKTASTATITVEYTSGPTTYSVTYDGNGNTSGDVPTDDNAYTSGATVTVLGNTGNLAKSGYNFGGWNTKDDGTGTNYVEGNEFSISDNTTLYAKWNAKTITGLAYTGTPTKTTYVGGESFDPTGLTVTATFDDSSEENVTTSVTWTPDPLTAGTTSVTGTYMGETIVVNGLTVTAAPGSAENPYTVAQAIAATPASGTSANVYINGIVSRFYNTSITGDATYHRYYISDDGNQTNELLVFNGKGLNNVAFSSADDLQVGDIITICGGLTTYSNTKEVAANNYITSLKRKENSDLTITSSSPVALEITTANLNPTSTITWSTSSTGDVICTSSDNAVATVTDAGVITAQGEGTATITIYQEADDDYKEGEKTVTVNVTDNRSACATAIDLPAAQKTLIKGAIGDFAATSTKTAGFTGEITYTYETSDASIISLATGNFSADGVGTATITVTATPTGGNANAYKPASQEVAVTVNGTNSISLDPTSKTVAFSTSTFDIEATVPTDNYDGTVTAVSSNTDVATVAVDGTTVTVTPKAVGTTTITVTAGTGTYYLATAQAECDIEFTTPEGGTTAYVPVETVFSETFDGCDGTGGNDGSWSGQIASSTLTQGESTSTTGWTFANEKAANQCAKLGAGSGKGSAQTPALGATGTLSLSFRAGAWNGNSEGTTLNLSVSAGTIDKSSVTLTKGAFNTFTATITNATAETKIKFEAANASNNRFFLDDVVVTKAGAPITATLNASGYATFCSQYPLDFSDYATADYSAWQITSIGSNAITFEQVKGKVKGGTGLLLKGEAGATVTLTSADSDNELTGNKLVGTLAPLYVAANEYYGLSGTTFVRMNAGTVKAGKAIIPAGEISTSAQNLTFVFEDNTTGINTVNDSRFTVNGEAYNLAGQKVSESYKGIVIVNGKKMIRK